MRLSRRRGQVTHVLLTRSPLIQNQQKPVPSPFDLHVLSTPPAFVLSQDQTLQTKPTKQAPTNHKQPARTQSQYKQPRKPDQGSTQPPTTTARSQANQNKTSPKNHTQQTKAHHAQPPGPNGIKNITHYRVLKQHTHKKNPQTKPARALSSKHQRSLP